MKHVVETIDLNLDDLTLEAAVQDLKDTPRGLDSTGTTALPGMVITKYVLHDIREPIFQKMAEPYLFGIAVDSRLSPVKIPWGLQEADTSKFALPKVGAEAAVNFGSDGAPLVLPPVQDFLALVLMVADSDNAKATAEVLKAIAGIASDPEVIKVAAGVNPPAGAILAVAGGLLNVAVKGIENNRDDIIAVFSAYYGPSKLIPGTMHRLTRPGAEVWLETMSE